MVRFSLATLVAISALSVAAPSQQQEKDTDSPNWKSHVKNVVVLVLENRSFDTFAGGLSYDPKIDGLLNRQFCQPVNVTNPGDKTTVCAAPTAPNVVPDDPNHAISGVNLQLYGTYHPDEKAIAAGTEKASMNGFLTEQLRAHTKQNISVARAAEALNYYAQDHVRVFASMAENFVFFNRWFAAVPGPTNPNRAYLTSGTSHGHGKNDVSFDMAGLPQLSIFQQLSEKNISWINYSNTSGFNPDSAFYTWSVCSGKTETNVKPLAKFYDDAGNGTLPQFSYINPECCSYQSFHPPSPVTDGEMFIKKVYESLRASPQWNETFFIMVFDEHGGFADHVPPPTNVPAGDNLKYTEAAPDGKNVTFDFTRLGVRVPALVISPWVGKGVIEEKGQNRGGEYTHTSIPAFIEELWGLQTLTPRVAWSSTFEHLITDNFRADTPEKLPASSPF